MKALTLQGVRGARGDVRLPGSKSISNRVLLLAAMAGGDTSIRNLLVSEDTQAMLTALAALGVGLERSDTEVTVRGRDGPLVTADRSARLDLGLAGTALRPLTAALTLGRGTFELTGTPRMLERPVGDLVTALRSLGARIDYLGADGYPPLAVHGTGLAGGTVSMRGNLSSQFLTSVLMAAPLAAAPVTVEIEGEQVSKPYLDLTLALMARFGVTGRHDRHQRFMVPTGGYRSPGTLSVEGDASSASYFLAAGAIGGGPVTVHGVGTASLQGDVAFTDVLTAMGARVTRGAEQITVRAGALEAFDLDLNAIPDAAMTAAVLALFARGTSRIRNVYNWRVKETDRMTALATELAKLGATVETGDDWIAITPPARLTPARIATYGDHRMAMCFSLVALGGTPVTIEDPDCVAKTFPDYFAVLATLYAEAA